MSDARLGRRWGVTARTVKGARERLGIPGHQRHQPRTGPLPDPPPDLGQVRDLVIAAREGVSLATVHRWRKKLGVAAYDRPAPVDLGQVPDRVIADREGMSVSAVYHWRKRLGIPSWREGLSSEDWRRHITNAADAWVCPEPELLGTMPDATLGALWDVSPMTVGRVRRDLGRKAYRDRNGRGRVGGKVGGGQS
jgi:hypothetical protein